MCVCGRLVVCCALLLLPALAVDSCRMPVIPTAGSISRQCASARCCPALIALHLTATAMSGVMIGKRYWRAWCDQLAEKLDFDRAEVARLEAELKVVKERMAVNQTQLDELTGKAPDAPDAAASSQSTLDIKRCKIAAVRSIGVQTD